MTASIRERLGARARFLVVATAAGWMTFVACMFFPAIPWPVMVGSFITVIAAILGLLLALRCPRCRHRLPQVGLAEVWTPAQAVKPRACPGCGIALDSAG